AVIRLPETRSSELRSVVSAPRRTPRKVTSYVVIGFLAAVPFAGFEATFSLFGGRRFNFTEGSTALVFLLVGVLMSVVQGALISPLTKRFGSLRLVVIGQSLVAVGMLALGASTMLAALCLALVLMVLGAGIAAPSLTALVANSADDDRRGEMLGIQQSASAFARVIGPPLAGLAFDGIGIGAPYTLGAMLCFAAVVVASKRL
ncbi:MAG: MFS transporter, partial [Actinomycetota bacterium]